MSKYCPPGWTDADRVNPEKCEFPTPYLVVLDCGRTTVDHCKRWGGMGIPEVAFFYQGWDYPWNARGGLRVAFWMPLPHFHAKWQLNPEGMPGEWVDSVT